MRRARIGLTVLISLMVAICVADEQPFAPLESVVAINVLLELDDGIADAAVRANQRVRPANVQSFTFDATHRPHISLLHTYVDRNDLAAIYAAVDQVAREFPLTSLNLAATGYDVSPWQHGALINITVEKSGELDRLQQALVRTLAPYFVTRGGEHAFARTESSSGIDDMTIDYVATFVTKHVGHTFKPHITVGLSDRTDTKRWESERFVRLVFQPAHIAVYQLGNYGTARRPLYVVAKP